MLVSAEAVGEGLLGSTVSKLEAQNAKLEEQNELNARSSEVLSSENDRLRQQMQLNELQATVDRQAAEIASLRAERDGAIAASRAMLDSISTRTE